MLFSILTKSSSQAFPRKKKREKEKGKKEKEKEKQKERKKERERNPAKQCVFPGGTRAL